MWKFLHLQITCLGGDSTWSGVSYRVNLYQALKLYNKRLNYGTQAKQRKAGEASLAFLTF